MLDNHIPRLREEQRICTANLYLTTALLVICAIVSFLTVEAITGWLLLSWTRALPTRTFSPPSASPFLSSIWRAERKTGCSGLPWRRT